jgi:hypothetical protein
MWWLANPKKADPKSRGGTDKNFEKISQKKKFRGFLRYEDAE